MSTGKRKRTHRGRRPFTTIQRKQEEGSTTTKLAVPDADSSTYHTKAKRPRLSSPLPAAAPDATPAAPFELYAFGANSSSELGLGPAISSASVRMRRNTTLGPVVRVAVGGMHSLALTPTGDVLSWGANDHGALGRETGWDGGLRDMDAEAAEEQSDSDSEGEKLNPRESTPARIELPRDVVGLAASDSASFAVTAAGALYGWGTFKFPDGQTRFSPETAVQPTPMRLDLEGVTQLACGENHVLALASDGGVWTWGAAVSQLGREVGGEDGLRPWRVEGIPGPVVAVGAGANHSFAILADGKMYAWGQSNFGQTGTGSVDEPVVSPKRVAWEGAPLVAVDGGNHHSVARTADGGLLAWGRVDGGATGLSEESLKGDGSVVRDARGRARACPVVREVGGIDGVVHIAAGAEHCVAVTEEGHAFGWGFGDSYRTGSGGEDDVPTPKRITRGGLVDRRVVWGGAGGQFGFVGVAL